MHGAAIAYDNRPVSLIAFTEVDPLTTFVTLFLFSKMVEQNMIGKQ